jgi:putative Mg2+ transporter-C (MgtC) family protein
MQIWPADPLFGGAVQSGRHLIELFAAFGLTALIGLEGVSAVLSGEDETD